MHRFEKLKSAKRIVIKVGSSTLTHPETGKANLKQIEHLAMVISDLRNQGKDIVLVSSGAVAVGMAKVKITERPKAIPHKQAMAAIGQSELMYMYDKFFGGWGNTAAQVLLTMDVMENERRKKNAQNTFETLLQLGIIPVVNENDTVSTEELEFGDNDTLSAMVAEMIGADLLVIFSDIEGLFDHDPRKTNNVHLIPVVEEITDDLKAIAGGAGSKAGTGGMSTKISAAEIATKAGIDMVITTGNRPEGLYELLDGKPVGTLFVAK